MKRKILLSILIIFLILNLTSCRSHYYLDGLEEEDRAEEAVYHYWQAIINRQYELAKWYCITGGIWYNKTDEWEEYINTNSEGEASVIVSKPRFQGETEVIGNNAIVYIKVSISKITFSNNHLIYKSETFEYTIDLIKISPPGDWELK